MGRFLFCFLLLLTVPAFASRCATELLRIATLQGLSVEYKILYPSAPTYLLIHGLAEDSRIWRGVANSLSDAGYNVATVDLHGHGKSVLKSRNSQAEIPFKKQIQDLELIFKEAQTPLRIVGHSYGGAVAIALAEAIQDQIEIQSVELLAPYSMRIDAYNASKINPHAYFLPKRLRLQWFQRRQAQIDFFLRPLIDTQLDRLLDGHIRRYLAEFSTAGDESEIRKRVDGAKKAMQGIMPINYLVASPLLAKEIPIRIWMAESDNLVPKEMSLDYEQALKERGNTVSSILVPKAGHDFPRKLHGLVARGLLEGP